MRTNNRATHCVILPILLAVVLVAPATADVDPMSLGQRNKDNRFALSAGAFFVRFNSSYAYKAEGFGERRFVDLEGQLDVPATEIVGNLAARFRIADRHHIMAEYSRFRRSGDRGLEGETIDIGGTTVGFNGRTTVEMNYDFVDVNYGYAFTRDERSSFIGELGVHIFRLESGYSIVGELVVDGNTYPSDIEGGDVITAAFPLLGVAIEFQMARRWIIVNSVDAVYLPVGDIRGAAVRTLLAGGFLISRSVGLKLGLSYNYERLEYKTDSAIEEVEFDFSGIMASVFFVF